ncbi:MAG: hypothetical protein AVDCRST_MAG35-1512, partial [uncultured Quadrisphaera sp.]
DGDRALRRLPALAGAARAAPGRGRGAARPRAAEAAGRDAPGVHGEPRGHGPPGAAAARRAAHRRGGGARHPARRRPAGPPGGRAGRGDDRDGVRDPAPAALRDPRRRRGGPAGRAGAADRRRRRGPGRRRPGAVRAGRGPLAR